MKTVVVASGKGGTGKTTVTALFATLAAAEMPTVVADADVEGSNLPIALAAGSPACEAFAGMATAVVSEALCTGCGACRDACRFGAVRGAAGKAFGIDGLACEGCGACARVCPAGAIEMRAAVAGTACTAIASTGPIAFGRLEPGEDLSGRLVTEVRRLAAAEASRCGAGLLIVDGPPGVGCPVISAIADVDLVVAVTEPTVSGAHDLARLAQLAGRFRLPVAVVLNKADLSEEGAARIRGWCRESGLPLIGEVPFDPALAGFLGSMAASYASPTPSPGTRALSRTWGGVLRMLGRDGGTVEA